MSGPAACALLHADLFGAYPASFHSPNPNLTLHNFHLFLIYYATISRLMSGPAACALLHADLFAG